MNQQFFNKILEEAEIVRRDLKSTVDLVMGQSSESDQISAILSLLVEKIRHSKTPRRNSEYVCRLLTATDWDNFEGLRR